VLYEALGIGEITGICPLEASEASSADVWLGRVAVILHNSIGVLYPAVVHAVIGPATFITVRGCVQLWLCLLPTKESQEAFHQRTCSA